MKYHSDKIRLFGDGLPQSPFKPGVIDFASKPQTARTLMLELAKLKARLKVMEIVRKSAQYIVDEAPNHDADAVPDWLDNALGNLSLALAATQQEPEDDTTEV